MNLSKPLWNAQLAGFFVRIPLGIYFFTAGRLKLENIHGFIEQVKSYKMLAEDQAILFAVALPYIEIAVGVLLVLGMFTTLAAGIGSLLLGTFIYTIGLVSAQSGLINKDVLLLGACLSLLCSGPGFLSIDRFRHSG